jgi:hypothetical protein
MSRVILNAYTVSKTRNVMLRKSQSQQRWLYRYDDSHDLSRGAALAVQLGQTEQTDDRRRRWHPDELGTPWDRIRRVTTTLSGSEKEWKER